MFERFKRKRIENKIFLSQSHKEIFARQCAFYRTEGIVRQLNCIKQAIHDKNVHEVSRRHHTLKLYGIKQPKTVEECNQLIEDLRKWRET